MEAITDELTTEERLLNRNIELLELLETKNAQIGALVQENQRLNTGIERIIEEVAGVREDFTALRQMIADGEEENAELQAILRHQIDILEEKVEIGNSLAKHYRDTIEALSEENLSLRQNIETRVGNHKEQAVVLRNRIQELVEANEALSAKNGRLEDSNSQIDRLLHEAEVQIEGERTLNAALSGRIERLLDANEELAQRGDNLINGLTRTADIRANEDRARIEYLGERLTYEQRRVDMSHDLAAGFIKELKSRGYIDSFQEGVDILAYVADVLDLKQAKMKQARKSGTDVAS